MRLDGWSTAWQQLFDEIATLTGEEGEQRLCALSEELEAKYSYQGGEPDRVVMCVELEIRQAGKAVWHQGYYLDSEGDKRGQAMARLVSLPVSLAIESIIKGEMPFGVTAAPDEPEQINAWLKSLEELGETIVHKDYLN